MVHRLRLPIVAVLLAISFLTGYVFQESSCVVKANIASVKDHPQQSKPVVELSEETKKKKAKRRGIVTHAPYDGPLARVFQNYTGELPCLEGKKPRLYQYGHGMKDDLQGMMYTKLSKCSSSTLAGISIQIARNTAARRRKAGTTNIPEECLVKCDHGINRFSMKRDKSKSMLWTFIREPASRQVSDFFHFHVSRRGVNPTDQKIFRAEALKGFQMFDYMSGHAFKSIAQDHDTPAAKVNYLFDVYDFVGLVERYHESLILLKMIYNLELRDILYASAKRSGGYDDGEYRDKCFFIYPSAVSPPNKQWFQNSTAWREYAETDNLLYRVVDKSIDLTIDAIGRPEVERQVRLLVQALQLANEVCGPTAIFPCTPEGKKLQPSETTCILHDWACSHECIDTLDLSQFQ